jgi:hypothetical protein
VRRRGEAVRIAQARGVTIFHSDAAAPSDAEAAAIGIAYAGAELAAWDAGAAIELKAAA